MSDNHMNNNNPVGAGFDPTTYAAVDEDMDNQEDIGPLQPNQVEARVLFGVLEHMEERPNVNWDDVAATAGLKNGNVARVRTKTPTKVFTVLSIRSDQSKVRYGQIRRKMGWVAKTASPSKKPTAATTKSVTPKATTPKKATTPHKSIALNKVTSGGIRKTPTKLGSKGKSVASQMTVPAPDGETDKPAAVKMELAVKMEMEDGSEISKEE